LGSNLSDEFSSEGYGFKFCPDVKNSIVKYFIKNTFWTKMVYNIGSSSPEQENSLVS
jgi:hypothetical protein